MNDFVTPQFIDEDGAYLRGIKSGWYAMDEVPSGTWLELEAA